jgi:hypothetical protein
MASTDRQMYIIVANHDRQECGVESIVSEESAMREIANYQKNGRNIDGYVSEFPSREAAEADAKAKHEEYHFLGDYKDVVKEMESDPRPR